MAGSTDGRGEALSRLPRTHSLALRLRDAGLTDELIADCLGVDPVALGPLMVIADAKLSALLAEPGD